MAQPQHARRSFVHASLAAAVCGVALLAAGAAPAMLAQGESKIARRAPKNTSPPTVSGTPQVDRVLTASAGTWSGSPTYAYQWRRCDAAGAACGDIAGARATTYTPGSADVGATVRVAVKATNAAGSTVATSAATRAVQATPAPAPGPFDPLTMTGDRLYTAAGTPWNTPIASGATADPGSRTMIADFSGAVAAGGGLVVSVKRWTVPVYVATASDPRFDVQMTASWRPANTMFGVPIPAAAAPDPAGDGHMTIFEPATGCEYDFWQAVRTTSGWSASWANSLPYDGRSTGVFPTGMSARGSGFALTAGLIWPQELAQGEIRHALVFSEGDTKSGGPVAPASESDGRTSLAGAIPEGARLQLDPSLDLNALGLTGYERTIAVALQRYGMYLADTGSPPGLYAVNPQSFGGSNPYAGIWGDQTYAYLAKIPADRFRVLTLPAQTKPPVDVAYTGCARMG